jgi:glycosyltransferase involved in cell wall biosynthesis
MSPVDVSLFAPSFDSGGVERMFTQLARGLAQRGLAVDLVVRRHAGKYLSAMREDVRLVELESLDRDMLRAAVKYLQDSRPGVLVSSKEDNNELAVAAKMQAGVATRVFVRAAIAESARVAAQFFLTRWRSYRAMRRIYRQADGVIAVSRDLAEDVASITGIPVATIHVAHNPVVTPEMFEQARAPLEHPWFREGAPPVIVGIGRLARVKNFALLIRAYARVRRELSCRLIILGEGRERRTLERLAKVLGVAGDVELAGFVENPFAYLSRARLFASASLAEGSPNALTEALALGIPVVSSDCRSGPREILQGGRYGALVPVGDEAALAVAMLGALKQSHDPEFLKQAALPYTLEGSTREYAAILGLGGLTVEGAPGALQ